MRRNRQTASMYSLTEFAYLLLFIFIGASVILFVRIKKDGEIISALKKETAFLQKMLDEKKDGAVPCWKRPGSPVPKEAGTLVIHSVFLYTVRQHSREGMDILGTDGRLPGEKIKDALLKMFKKDMTYAAEKKCYVRIRIDNETNNYSLYKQAAGICKELGLVVINE